MNYSPQQLTQIVQKSSTFEQRLNGNFLKEKQVFESQFNHKVLKKWQELVAFGDPDLFAKRFDWDGINFDTVRYACSNPQWNPQKSLPKWSQILEEVAALSKEMSKEAIFSPQFRFLNNEMPLPFEHALIPFVLVARKRLLKAVGTAHSRFQENALVDLERSLISYFIHICHQTFYLELSILRTKKPQQIKSDLTTLDRQDGLYRSFISSLYADGFVTFFREYTVLGRLLGLALLSWVQSSSELILRFEADLPTLVKTFDVSQNSEVVNLRTRLSDPHNNGRTVSILTLSEGIKIVYKPKELGLDVAYYGLVNWFNELQPSLNLTAVKVLNQGSYGWAEYIQQGADLNHEATERYYRRMGMLLCLVYVLEGTDCHNENLIAAGENPILIDIETLLHPRLDPTGSEEAVDGAQNLAHQQYLNSVLRTALLPVWMFGQGGQSFDISGLGAKNGQVMPFKSTEWTDINTDRMKLKQVQSFTELPSVSPTINGQQSSADDFLNEIVDGFREGYLLLLENKDDLLCEVDGPIVHFKHQKSRFVFRHTMNYFLLNEKLLQPKFLRDGMERSIQLDVLKRTAIRGTKKPSFWPLLNAEKSAMEQLDIPYFCSNSNDQSVSSAKSKLTDEFFNIAGYDLVFERIKSLTNDDMERQIGFIQAAFRLRFKESKPAIKSSFQTSLNETPVYHVEAILQAALDVGEDISRQAIIGSNGSASWLGFEHVLEAERAVIQPLGYNLHSGSGGIALFLSALNQAFPGKGYRELALGGLQQLRSSLREDQKMTKLLSRRMSLGGAIGLGALVYCLTRINDFIDEPGLLDDALLVASCIEYERIEKDTKLDVMDGVAGAILGLLALYGRVEKPELLEKADACGQHLLNTRQVSASGERVWATVDSNKLLTGFSHGAAGIAYALFRLYNVTNKAEYHEAALEALAFETKQFDEQAGNWIDILHSTPQQQSFGKTWCHGAPGIGLARLGGLPIWDSNKVREDIHQAIRTTGTLFQQDLDTVCCGNLGRTDLYLKASTLMDATEEYRQMALQQVSWVIHHRTQTGSYRLPYGLGAEYSHDYQLGFFHGLSGIGYQLLRATHPEQFPSVLLWE